MQINNSPLNFGSIQLTKEANSKSTRVLTTEILKEFKVNMLASKMPDEIRKKLKPATVNIIPHIENGMKITAITKEEELSILERIINNFDPKAAFIDDFEKTGLNILG